MNKKKIQFSKMHGAGNDFIVLGHSQFEKLEAPKDVRYLCHRKLGVGSDGLVILKDHPRADFEMLFFNPDGSQGMLCGNGARCAAQFAYDRGHMKKDGEFIAVDGHHQAHIHSPGDVEISMSYAAIPRPELNGWCLDTGSPHYVERYTGDFYDLDVNELGGQIRHHKAFQPHGTNANFFKLINGQLHLRTFERGVEAETLACGTGVVAAAIVYHHMDHRDEEQFHFEVISPGGSFEVKGRKTNHSYAGLYLRGPVQEVFESEIEVPDQLPDVFGL